MAVAETVGRAVQVERVQRRAEAQRVEDLFTEHHRLVYAYCLRHLRSPEEAEDAVQATYLNACRTLMQGFEPDVARAWLLKVAQNVCLTRIRSRTRRARLEVAEDLHAVEERLPAPEAGDELFGLDDALASLPEQQRRAILLREWQGLSYREVAVKLGLTQSAVETLIFRARRSLAAALEHPGERRRPRLLHSLDLSAVLASLKSGLSTSMSSSLATSVAVAASVGVIAGGPVVAGPDPLVRPAAKPAQERIGEPLRRIDAPVRFTTEAARAEQVVLAGREGPPAWAGRRGGADKAPARAAAKAAAGQRTGKALGATRGGKRAGVGGGPPPWAPAGGSSQGAGPPAARGGRP